MPIQCLLHCFGLPINCTIVAKWNRIPYVNFKLGVPLYTQALSCVLNQIHLIRPSVLKSSQMMTMYAIFSKGSNPKLKFRRPKKIIDKQVRHKQHKGKKKQIYKRTKYQTWKMQIYWKEGSHNLLSRRITYSKIPNYTILFI